MLMSLKDDLMTPISYGIYEDGYSYYWRGEDFIIYYDKKYLKNKYKEHMFIKQMIEQDLSNIRKEKIKRLKNEI